MRPAAIAEDLRRRDVTVNAIALDLRSGALLAADHALDDLAAGRLRVLHDASLRDDPTRLWRIARYAARLGFALEPHTAQLAAEAVAAGAVERVSGARIGNELRLALGEPDPVAALEAAVALGLAPWLAPDRVRTDAALALLPAGEGRPDLVVLAAALAEAATTLTSGSPGWTSRRPSARCCAPPRGRPQIAAAALAAGRPSELARALRGLPVEAVALAGRRGAAEPVRRWLGELRHVALAIDGNDLIAAGVPRGPQIGRRLAAVLERRLDGELGDDRDAQLAAALTRARAGRPRDSVAGDDSTVLAGAHRRGYNARASMPVAGRSRCRPLPLGR